MNVIYRCKHHQHNIRSGKKKVSGVEDMIEEMDISIKNVQSKNVTSTKHLGNPAHYEKAKPKDNRNKRGKSITSSEAQKMFLSK